MRLYDTRKQRLYLNAAERSRFLNVARKAEGPQRTLALTLLFTGCRLSEALELTTDAIQPEARVIAVRCLKKRRGEIVIREIPVPADLIREMEQVHAISRRRDAAERLWSLSRTSGWALIKEMMAAAGIHGKQACPKGLRHAYGVHAIRCGIQLHLLQKWMGHASMATTAVYANILGEEEWRVARRMWAADTLT